MTAFSSVRGAATSMALLATALPAAAQNAAAQSGGAMVPAPAPAMAGVDPARMQRLINTMPDTPGSGPYPAIKEEASSLPAHTVYRPADLSRVPANSMGLVVWGNGGCMGDGAFTRFHLSELASHGYLVIANGTILSGPGKPPLDLSRPPMPPRAGNGATPAPATTPRQLVEAIDWALAENGRQGSPLHGKLRPGAIAVSGGSCGGLQALQVAASDKRVRTAVIHNSGIFKAGGAMPGIELDKSALDRLHAPLIYILGGPSDIAYANGMDDFARITRVPVAVANDGNVGHGGTFFDDNGGEGAKVAVAWLDWQLKGRADARQMFVGRNCRLCTSTRWSYQFKGGR